MEKKNKSVVIVGGGIAGIQAALDLAEIGVKVHIVEDTPSIGGRMPQLDKTFPTNDCSICILAPKMSECARHPNIELHICSALKSVRGIPGNFTCEIIEYPKYVDPEKCIACGRCEEKCPTKVVDEFDMELRERKAIYRYFLQSIPSKYVIDSSHCLYLTKGACRLCEKECERGAINFEDSPSTLQLTCGAIILASGIDPFNPIPHAQYGYKRYKNVITSLEFERLLSASGPTRGEILRPSDKKQPKKIAFIQCVGSRDVNVGSLYCSSVCCMYAIKEAIIVKEHIEGVESTIFYMDIRAFGKDFDKYYERAKKQFGVKFVHSKSAEIKETENDNLVVRFTEENGKRKEEEFELVVLSVGLRPREGIYTLGDATDIKVDEYGFCKVKKENPVTTTTEGVFVSGAMSGPKDIPESVMSGSGAVMECVRFLGVERGEKISTKEFPKEKNVIGDRPRVGVFICHCGINIAGILDVDELVGFAKTLKNVEYVENILYACSQDALNLIKERIKEYNLNRIVVAACTPRTHEPLFRETLREAGLNQHLFEMANIRDQCSWAHMEEGEVATEKAKDLIKMSVERVKEGVPLSSISIEIQPSALVIGGGIAGMNAALGISEAGYKVVLVEKEDNLGGNLTKIYWTLEGIEVPKLLKETIKKVENNPLIEVYTGAAVEEVSGYIGNYESKIRKNGGEIIEFKHGIIVVATGGEEHRVSDYFYGENERVITQLELEKILYEERLKEYKPTSIVMIQCVEGREEGRLYCSRVCCGEAIKNAIKIKEKYKEKIEVYILYRDIRTYGLKEKYYTEARDKGVIFINYDLENKPKVEVEEEKLKVKVWDHFLSKYIVIDADLLVLSPPIVPASTNEELSKLLKVPLNEDKFFLEAHVKLRPIDFATDGIFVCGLAHNPKYIDESIAQAKGAAARALTILNRKFVEKEGTVCVVDENRCVGCGVCVNVCAYSGVELKEKIIEGVKQMVAYVNEAVCKGCGACSSTCKSGAIEVKGVSKESIVQAIKGGV